jgi:hypothetical protein
LHRLRRFARATLPALTACLWCDVSLADQFDLALHGDTAPVGEISARTELGAVALALRHSEYLGYLNRNYREDGGEENPLVRSTLVDSSGILGLDSGAGLPYGIAFALDEWESGERELRVTGRGGLEIGDLRLDHSLTLATRYAVDGSETRHGSGRFSLGGDVFGGRQEGVIEYDAMPAARVTRLGFQSDWQFEDGGALVAGLDHRPLERISEARFGLRQQIGAFDMTSDFAADSTGAYSLGISFSLALNGGAAGEAWRLSSQLSALRAERRPPLARASGSFLDDN